MINKKIGIDKLVIFLTAYSFLVYGLAFALLPLTMAQLTIELSPVNASTFVDIRATYGGTNMAVGLFMLYLAHSKQRKACLVFIVVVLLVMAITRTLGLLLHDNENAFMYVMLVLELLGSALAAAILRTKYHHV